MRFKTQCGCAALVRFLYQFSCLSLLRGVELCDRRRSGYGVVCDMPISIWPGTNAGTNGPLVALEEQVGLDIKQDWEGTKKFMHSKGCFWGDMLPVPVSNKSESYYQKLRAAEDEIPAHHLVPVSVVVVDDVAIINFYLHTLTRPRMVKRGKGISRTQHLEEGEGRWLLLSTYNTKVSRKTVTDNSVTRAACSQGTKPGLIFAAHSPWQSSFHF